MNNLGLRIPDLDQVCIGCMEGIKFEQCGELVEVVTGA